MNIHQIAHHRNGVDGEPFHAIIFETDPGDDYDAELRAAIENYQAELSASLNVQG